MVTEAEDLAAAKAALLQKAGVDDDVEAQHFVAMFRAVMALREQAEPSRGGMWIALLEGEMPADLAERNRKLITDTFGSRPRAER